MTRRKSNQKRTSRKPNSPSPTTPTRQQQHQGFPQTNHNHNNNNPTSSLHPSPIPQSTRYSINGHLNRSNSSPLLFRDNEMNSQLCLDWSEVTVKNSEIPARRGFHSCTCVGDKLYIIGGDAQSTFFSDVHTYNIVSQKWEHSEKSLLNPRTGHTCVHYQGCLYLFGGKQSKILSNGTKQESYLSDLLIYDLAKKEWTKAENNIKLVPRGAHSCSVIDSQKRMYIFGGLTPAYGNSVQGKTVDLEYLNTVCVYDFELKQWVKIRCKGDIPPMRAGHASCVVGDFIYVFGGRKGSNLLQDFYVLDTAKHVWRKIYQKNPPSTRAGHSMCYYPQGHSIILWGGGDWGRFFDDVWTFDVSDFKASGEWQLQQTKTGPSSPGARFWHTSVIHKDFMYIFGGGNKTTLFNDLFVLNLAPLASARSRHPASQHKRVHSQPFVNVDALTITTDALANRSTTPNRGTEPVPPRFSGNNQADQSQRTPRDEPTTPLSSTSTTTTVANSAEVIFGFTKIKTVYQGEMRILKLPYGVTYNDLLERLRGEYGSNGVVVRYIDEENDAITIRSDDELRSAAEYFQNFQKAPRFEIEIVKNLPQQPKTPVSAHSSRSKSPQSDQSDISGEKTFNWTRGEKIGEGAYGTVYVAINTDTGEFMAAKHIIFGHVPQDERQRAVLEVGREIELMKNIAHENIVRYLGVERHRNSLYIFLEYVSGGSLASLLKRFRLGEGTVRIYTRQILQGLKYLHDHDIVHRDIKGANILVSTTGVIKLADFGHSRVLEKSDASLSLRAMQNKSIRGTPMWMAPEVIQSSQHGKWSDVWSVGCVVVEMLSGSYPYPQLKNEDAMKVMWKIGHSDIRPTIPDFISPAGREFLDKIFQRDYKQRASVEELMNMEFITQAFDNNNNGNDVRGTVSPMSDYSHSEEAFDVDTDYTSSSEFQSYVSGDEEEEFEDEDEEYTSEEEDDEGLSEEDTSTFESYVSEDEEGSDDEDSRSTSSSYDENPDQNGNMNDVQESLASIEKQMQNLRMNKMLNTSPATRKVFPNAQTGSRSQVLSQQQQLRQIRPSLNLDRFTNPSNLIHHTTYGQLGGRLPSGLSASSAMDLTPTTTTTQQQQQQQQERRSDHSTQHHQHSPATEPSQRQPEASEQDIVAFLGRIEKQRRQMFSLNEPSHLERRKTSIRRQLGFKSLVVVGCEILEFKKVDDQIMIQQQQRKYRG